MGSYKVFDNKVIQGEYQARAISPNEIISDYQSLGKRLVSPIIKFKFALNGKDNELVSGRDHEFVCNPQNGYCETPLIVFGKQLKENHPISSEKFLDSNIDLRVRLDMRHVLAAFERDGFYETFDGQKVYKDDFKGVYLAGNVDPLSWDFDDPENCQDLKLQDEDGDGIYECQITLNPRIINSGAKSWKLSKDISSYPTYSSEQLLVDALYNMSLGELMLNIEEDGTFRTGKEWAGVWTRDISYSAILSLVMLNPDICKTSLRHKINNGRIVQDTGTGGAYPVSTDRVVWAIAAWEVYLVMGDMDWLQEIYPVIKRSLEDDLLNAFDSQTGLFKGESSFLDWREQTYPDWMQPSDIYESESLGTNAVHYKAHTVLADIAAILEDTDTSKRHNRIALNLKKSINSYLWLEEKGYYSQYLYGRNYKINSPRAEALGAALTIFWDIAEQDRQEVVVAKFPVIDYGTPSIFPQIPDIPPYHNDGIWPFVQAFWSLSAAKVGNETAVTHSLDALYRAAALFLSNKENFVADSGDFGGTQVNSDRQLWSVAGNLAMIYKVFYGMDYQEDRLVFRPFVPEKYAGKKKLTGFKYRDSILNLELEGWGSKIKEVKLDGKVVEGAYISANLSGNHTLSILLEADVKKDDKINLVANYFSPKTPEVFNLYGKLSWKAGQNISKYIVLRNGMEYKVTDDPLIDVGIEGYGEYQVIAIDRMGVSSFASEPIVLSDQHQFIVDMTAFGTSPDSQYRGYSGMGYIPINTKENTKVEIEFEVEEAGLYSISFVYSNGHGPVNTNNKCALRSLYQDGKLVGTVIFPQRGEDSWSDWGNSNAIQITLQEGKNHLVLSMEDHNINMDVEINEAMLDRMEVVKIE